MKIKLTETYNVPAHHLEVEVVNQRWAEIVVGDIESGSDRRSGKTVAEVQGGRVSTENLSFVSVDEFREFSSLVERAVEELKEERTSGL